MIKVITNEDGDVVTTSGAVIDQDRIATACASSMFGNEHAGFCLACGAEAEGCEPDATGYKCETCGALDVIGAELLTVCIMA